MSRLQRHETALDIVLGGLVVRVRGASRLALTVLVVGGYLTGVTAAGIAFVVLGRRRLRRTP